MNTFGQHIHITLFGESHGAAVGAVLDGLPPGETVDWEAVKREMARRAPGQSALTTARREADAFQIECGYFEGHTTGTPLCVRIQNTDTHSQDYAGWRQRIRPGHADYTAQVRYRGCQDYRGGGHFSGRLTAPLVFAGAIAKQILAGQGIRIAAHIQQIGDIRDDSFRPVGEEPAVLKKLSSAAFPLLHEDRRTAMEACILQAKQEGDSVGGMVELMAQGIPAGWGDPFFGSVESVLAALFYAVPAVKGVTFGSGAAFAAMRGSQANDAWYYEAGRLRTRTNHNGGINGGITNGMPLLCRVTVKPTPSIARVQETVDIEAQTAGTIQVPGRHDPCIVPRAVPVLEAVLAWGLLDLYLGSDTYRGA